MRLLSLLLLCSQLAFGGWIDIPSNGVTTINGTAGDLNIVGGTGIGVSTVGTTITISSTVNAVSAVILPFTASSTVTAMQMVIATTATTAAPGNDNTTVQNASVIGIAMTGAAVSGTFNALVFGTITDASFSGFTLNNPVYLNTTGFLTQTLPTTPSFMTVCGKYIGNNTVFINISQPVQL